MYTIKLGRMFVFECFIEGRSLRLKLLTCCDNNLRDLCAVIKYYGETGIRQGLKQLECL